MRWRCLPLVEVGATAAHKQVTPANSTICICLHMRMCVCVFFVTVHHTFPHLSSNKRVRPGHLPAAAASARTRARRWQQDSKTSIQCAQTNMQLCSKWNSCLQLGYLNNQLPKSGGYDLDCLQTSCRMPHVMQLCSLTAFRLSVCRLPLCFLRLLHFRQRNLSPIAMFLVASIYTYICIYHVYIWCILHYYLQLWYANFTNCYCCTLQN